MSMDNLEEWDQGSKQDLYLPAEQKDTSIMNEISLSWCTKMWHHRRRCKKQSLRDWKDIFERRRSRVSKRMEESWRKRKSNGLIICYLTALEVSYKFSSVNIKITIFHYYRRLLLPHSPCHWPTETRLRVICDTKERWV